MKREQTSVLLNACTEMVVIQEEYQPSVYSQRNRYMAERSDRVIAVYDGREKGGTVRTSVLHTAYRKNCVKSR